MKNCPQCGYEIIDSDSMAPDHECDDDPDFMFEDLRPSQPDLIDLSGMPDPVEDAMRERAGKTLQ